MAEYINVSIDDPQTIEWLSNPHNIAAVLGELSQHFEECDDTIIIHDHQVYAAIGRVMMERREYGRSIQELRSAGFMDIVPGYLSNFGYTVEIQEDDPPSSSGRRHKHIIARKQ